MPNIPCSRFYDILFSGHLLIRRWSKCDHSHSEKVIVCIIKQRTAIIPEHDFFGIELATLLLVVHEIKGDIVEKRKHYVSQKMSARLKLFLFPILTLFAFLTTFSCEDEEYVNINEFVDGNYCGYLFSHQWEYGTVKIVIDDTFSRISVSIANRAENHPLFFLRGMGTISKDRYEFSVVLQDTDEGTYSCDTIELKGFYLWQCNFDTYPTFGGTLYINQEKVDDLVAYYCVGNFKVDGEEENQCSETRVF